MSDHDDGPVERRGPPEPGPRRPGPPRPGPRRDGSQGPGPGGPLPPAVRNFLRFGLIAFPGCAVLLGTLTPLGWLEAIFASILLVLFPTLSIAQTPLIEEARIDRRTLYLNTLFMLVVIGGMSLSVGWVVLVGGEQLGEVGAAPAANAEGLTGLPPTLATLVEALPIEPGAELPGGALLADGTAAEIALPALALLGAALVWVVIVRAFMRATGRTEHAIVRHLLPRTPSDKGLFAILSLGAGFGEELAYRGFLFPAMTVVFGSPAAGLLLSSGAFGLAHGYQGEVGMVRTGVLGVIFGVGVLATGSLWPAVVAHTVADLLLGLVIRDRLLD